MKFWVQALVIVSQMLLNVEVCTYKLHRKLGCEVFLGCSVYNKGSEITSMQKRIKKGTGFSLESTKV